MSEPQFALKVGVHKKWEHSVLRTSDIKEVDFYEKLAELQQSGFEVCAATTQLDGQIVVFLKRPELPSAELVEVQTDAEN